MASIPTYHQEALILARRDWREYDRMYTIVTESGKQTIRAIGSRRPKSKLAGRLEPWSVSKLMLVHSKTIDIVADSQPVLRFTHAESSFPAYFFGAWLAEFVDRLLPEEDPSAIGYALVVEAFTSLNALALLPAPDWIGWWREWTDTLLSHAGMKAPAMGSVSDPDRYHEHLEIVIDRRLRAFSCIRPILYSV